MAKLRAGSILLKTVAIAAGCLVAATLSWGSLGGDASSIQADQVHMQGSRRAIAAESYTVHEIQAANGTVVREYASPEGKVFAVAWHGPWPPDMRQLLGNYFDQFTKEAASRSSGRMGRRPVMIEVPGLVVQIAGHPRAFAGKAYVPEMVPASMHAEDIQ